MPSFKYYNQSTEEWEVISTEVSSPVPRNMLETDVQTDLSKIGDTSTLQTTDKTTLVNALNEVKGNVNTNTNTLGTLQTSINGKLSKLSGDLTAVTTWSAVQSLMTEGDIIVTMPSKLNNALLPNTDLSYGNVTITMGTGGRISAIIESVLSSNIVVYAGTYNNANSTMLWKQLTTAEGKYTVSGAGATSLTIPHGLGTTPSSYVNVREGTADSGTAQINYVTADSTNITVYFKNALPTGTNNITLYWKAKL